MTHRIVAATALTGHRRRSVVWGVAALLAAGTVATVVGRENARTMTFAASGDGPTLLSACTPTTTTDTATGTVTVKFTTVGSCTWDLPAGSTDIDVLVVGGGGSGGRSNERSVGGGGGGGVAIGTDVGLEGSLTITVGAGGTNTQDCAAWPASASGGESSISNTAFVPVGTDVGIVADGGPVGAGCGDSGAGRTGGSGAGGHSFWVPNGGLATKGTITRLTGITLYGNAGGNGGYSSGLSGGGGGGAGAAGSAGLNGVGGDGGEGIASDITGTEVIYGSGGGGIGQSGDGAGGTNAGDGMPDSGAGTVGDAVANTGGGGGGAYNQTSGSGGSGIVVIRYVPGIETTTTIAADTPDPSFVGTSYTVSGTVDLPDGEGESISGDLPGEVTVSGDGSGCTDTTLVVSESDSDTFEFSCAITSTTAGEKTLAAEYSGATGLADSTSDDETHTVKVRTTINYTGEQYVPSGTTSVTLRAVVGPSACRSGSVDFAYDSTGNGVYDTAIGSGTIDASTGVATYTWNAASPTPLPAAQIIDIEASYTGAADCTDAVTAASIVRGGSGDSSSGGGAYNVSGAGRVILGYTVQVRSTHGSTTVTGQLLWYVQGKSRVKGTVSTFTQVACPAQSPAITAGARCGYLTGTATVSVWDSDTSTWSARSTGVAFRIWVADGGTATSCTKSRCSTTVKPDWFRLDAPTVELAGESTVLVQLGGGNVVVR